MSNRRIRFSSPWFVMPIVVSVGILGTVLVQSHTASAHGRSECPHPQHHRTAKETIERHLALMQAGQMEEAICDYAENAVVIMPGQTISGRKAIGEGLLGMGSLLGGALPQIQSFTTAGSIVMITFSAYGTPCTIPDGSDTYIVEHGQIVAQTVHDSLYSAEGAICPLAAPRE